MAGHTIFNQINDIDFDLKKIKLQVLITETLESKINRRIGEIAINTGKKPKPLSTYVRELIEEDCSKIKIIK